MLIPFRHWPANHYQWNGD